MSFILVTSNAHAISSSLSCPSSVKAGTQLNVNIVVANWDYLPVTLKAADVFLMGNSVQNTLLSMGFWGPFRRTGFGPIDFPAYNNYSPASVEFNIKVMDSVPASLAGKMAIVSVNLINSSNHDIDSKNCFVNVTN